jgi:hypothetical protein
LRDEVERSDSLHCTCMDVIPNPLSLGLSVTLGLLLFSLDDVLLSLYKVRTINIRFVFLFFVLPGCHMAMNPLQCLQQLPPPRLPQMVVMDEGLVARLLAFTLYESFIVQPLRQSVPH